MYRSAISGAGTCRGRAARLPALVQRRQVRVVGAHARRGAHGDELGDLGARRRQRQRSKRPRGTLISHEQEPVGVRNRRFGHGPALIKINDAARAARNLLINSRGQAPSAGRCRERWPGAAVVCLGLLVGAAPAVVVIVVVEVNGEPSRPNDVARVRSGREADAHVVAEPCVVGERHGSGAEIEVGVSRVVGTSTLSPRRRAFHWNFSITQTDHSGRACGPRDRAATVSVSLVSPASLFSREPLQGQGRRWGTSVCATIVTKWSSVGGGAQHGKLVADRAHGAGTFMTLCAFFALFACLALSDLPTRFVLCFCGAIGQPWRRFRCRVDRWCGTPLPLSLSVTFAGRMVVPLSCSS